MTAPVVFASFARADAPLYRELAEHLSPLVAARRIELWTMYTIAPGAERDIERSRALERARLFLLLLSASFFADSACLVAMSSAIDRGRQGGAPIVPILVRACDMSLLPAEVAIFPDTAVPVASSANHDEAWARVVAHVHSLLDGPAGLDPSAPPAGSPVEVTVYNDDVALSWTGMFSSLATASDVLRRVLTEGVIGRPGAAFPPLDYSIWLAWETEGREVRLPPFRKLRDLVRSARHPLRLHLMWQSRISRG